MNIRFKQHQLPDGRLVLSVSGDIDLDTAGRFMEELKRAFAIPGVLVVELDLRGLTHLDSTGLGQLIAAHQGRYSSTGQQFEVTDIQRSAPRIYRIFRISGLSETFRLAEPKELPETELPIIP